MVDVCSPCQDWCLSLSSVRRVACTFHPCMNSVPVLVSVSTLCSARVGNFCGPLLVAFLQLAQSGDWRAAGTSPKSLVESGVKGKLPLCGGTGVNADTFASSPCGDLAAGLRSPAGKCIFVHGFYLFVCLTMLFIFSSIITIVFIKMIS